MAITAQQEQLFGIYEANARSAPAGTAAARAIEILDRERAKGKDYVMWEGTRGIRVGPRSAFEIDEEKKVKAAARRSRKATSS